MENRYYDDEREIDLIDILGRIIAKWRPILVVALIGLLVGTVISCTMGYINMQKSDVEAKKMSAAKAEQLALEKLLKDEKGKILQENADNALANYISIQAMYDMQQEYNEKSIYKNLDANHIARVNLTYNISTDLLESGGTNSEDIIDAYRVYLTSDTVCSDIIKTTGLDTEPKYIRELVKVNPLNKLESDTNSSQVNVNVNGTKANLSIDVITDNADLSSVIANCINSAVDTATSNVIASFGEVDAILLNNELYMESDFDIIADQNKADKDLIQNFTDLQAIENSMSGAQQDYFKAILAKYNLETVEIEAVDRGYFSYVSKVLIVLAAVAAAFVAVAVYGVIYLFDGCVKTGEELANMGHGALLGTILTDNDKKKKNVLFDKWAAALTDKRAMCEDPDRMRETIVKSIAEYMNSNSLHNAILVGADIAHIDIVDKITEGVTAAGITVKTAMDAFDSPETVGDITSSDAVILVGETCRTKYKKLERILSLCRLYNKRIVGTVSIQERI